MDDMANAFGDVLRESLQHQAESVLRAVGDVVRHRLDSHTEALLHAVADASLSTAPPVQAPPVHVTVDMTPVADAIREGSKSTGDLAAAMVLLAEAMMVKREPRTIKIKHDDGSESTAKEQ